MKAQNCTVGRVIEAKHDCYGLSREFIPKGLRVTVHTNDKQPTYPVKVIHEDIEGGYAWVEPMYFRKIK